MDTAKQFFRQALAVVGHALERVTTDEHTSYLRARDETMGSEVLHRKNKYLNTWLEQDHRGVKQREYPMHGFGSFKLAAHFCCAFDELRNDLRPRRTMGKKISLPEQRRAFLQRLAALQTSIIATS
jgi:putative transposase